MKSNSNNTKNLQLLTLNLTEHLHTQLRRLYRK